MTASALAPEAQAVDRPRVLVAEKIGDSGIELLREHFNVDVGVGWSREELEQRIGDYDGILIRSATNLDAQLLSKAARLRAVGRAGVGVDNVDVPAATKRGIVVANAPQSNVITAAEHTMALLLALARNIPQAHASLTGGAWERSKFSGVELDGKALGILGFGRIGQLVAQRARGFGMRVIAFDPFVAADRFRELGVEQASSSDEVYAAADFLTLHLPKTPETEGWLDAEALAKCKDGVRVLNVARGPLVVEEDLKAALDSGKVAGAALDVFSLRARDRASAVRIPERDRDAPPRGLDGGGHRPGRLSGGRAGDRGAYRRGRHERGQCACHSERGHGGARAIRASVPLAGQNWGGAR